MERFTRVAGVASVLGGALLLVASVPGRWYGVPETDAYLFDPAPLSPLWISRTVVPALTALAVIGLVVGLAGLLHRDWSNYRRLRRWSGVAAFLGLSVLSLGVIASTGLDGSQTETAIVGALFVLLTAVLGVLLFAPGALGLGYGYLRAGNRAVGGGLLVVPVAVPVLAYLGVGPDGLLTMLPVAITWLLLGRDLFGPKSDFQGPDRPAT